MLVLDQVRPNVDIDRVGTHNIINGIVQNYSDLQSRKLSTL
jgi:hypothetical protein